MKNHPVFAPGIIPLNSYKDFKDHYWQFTGPMTGFKGYYNQLAGYAHSSNAMKGIHRHLVGRGVKFILGPQQGKVVKLLYDNDNNTTTQVAASPSSQSGRCTGFQTADGHTHQARRTILCLGACAAQLIPQIGSFIVAKTWSVAHVQLTESECDYLRNIPVLNVRDLGFFFEPDPATRLLKICPLGAGFINTDSQTGISLPPSGAAPAPQDYIPASDEKKLRQLLRETLPWLADRPFVDQKMCWFADTRDSEYCVDFVPNTGNSLIVLSGDSGHGFKMMPIVGQWVAKLLEDGKQELARWRWKQTKGKGGKEWGDEVSWRIGTTKEIKTVIEEQERMVRARL